MSRLNGIKAGGSMYPAENMKLRKHRKIIHGTAAKECEMGEKPPSILKWPRQQKFGEGGQIELSNSTRPWERPQTCARRSFHRLSGPKNENERRDANSRNLAKLILQPGTGHGSIDQGKTHQAGVTFVSTA